MTKLKKLESLSREELSQLNAALDEQARRKREAKSAFTPHKEQLEVISDDHSKRIVICGNGWGKSALGANEAIWAALGYNPITKGYTPVPAKVVVVLDAPEKVAETWLPELRKWANIAEEQLFKDGKPYISRITFSNGSAIRFMFFQQESLQFESIETDMVIIDEPPSRDIWVALLRSGRKKNRKARYLMICTPISQHWVREYHTEWGKGKFADTRFFRGHTEANRANLAEGYIEEFSLHLTAKEKATRLQGEFFNTDGMALAGLLDRSKHLVLEASLPADYKQAWPHVIQIDPHPNKPTYASILAAAPGGKSYYVGEISRKVVPREFGRWLKENWLATHRIVDIVCDSSGNADFTGGEGFKSFLEVLQSMGIRVRATTYDEKKDVDFLTRLQEGLHVPEGGEPMLQFVIGKCAGVWHNLENVQWKPQKGSEDYQPKLEISNQDFLATLKYGLAANLTFDNAKRKIYKPKTASPWAGKGQKEGYMERAWRGKASSLEDDDF